MICNYPQYWRKGASDTTEAEGQKINENKLSFKKKGWTSYGITKYIICMQQLHQDGHYCQTSSYKNHQHDLIPCKIYNKRNSDERERKINKTYT
ncbi:hypothetical protein AMTRI_Chr09g33220 [Amborella trichopoda]